MPATTGRRVTLAMPRGQACGVAPAGAAVAAGRAPQADEGVAADFMPKTARPIPLALPALLCGVCHFLRCLPRHRGIYM